MLESRQISHNVVLPTLEAAGMVSSVKDVDTDTIQVSSQPDPEPDNHDEAAHTSHPVIRYNSPWRFSRLLSLVIPPLLAAFILYGWYFASRFVIPYLCSTYPGYICMIYTLTFHTLLATTTGLFFFIWLLPNSHSATPPVLPHLLRAKLVPHEVATQEGGYTECWQDNCKGRIIPPRARHCKDCRVCRLEFDHHCPWLGCIARDTFKAFILFLGFATVSIEVGLAPVYSLAWKQYNFVTDLAWEQDWMYNIWWNRIYSWLGGPMYRFLGAIFLSYSRYDNKSPSNIRAMIHDARLLLLLLHCSGCPFHRLRLVLLLVGILLVRLTSLSHLK